MSIFKRGRIYWYEFVFRGQRIQESTHQTNNRVAMNMESAHRTRLAQGEVGIITRRRAPTFRELALGQLKNSVETQCAAKPETVKSYHCKCARLLEFTPLANARLDQIDELLIDSYVQHRRHSVSPASVNRELATLRKSLRLAQEWHILDRVPRIHLLPGERIREFVLNHEQEHRYLESASRQLRDVAILSLDTGMRVGEARTLEWADVHLEPLNGAKSGYIHIGSGKSRNAKRNVLITPRVREMLRGRRAEAKTRYVFPSEAGTGPVSTYTLEAQHSRVRKAQGLDGYVIHSFRHTFGTRLGESGADAFSIMKAMGHSSVTISQPYVHPTPEAMERVWTRLNDLNQKSVASLPAITSGRQKPATMKSEVPTLVPPVGESGLIKAS